jgi:CheY-like chemotaxis protein
MKKHVLGRVLLVEDDEDLASLYATSLISSDFDVRIARDGEAAVQLALEGIPNIILLDLMLPKMGGLTVLKILKTRPETKDIPVVVLTVYPNPEYKDTALRDGAAKYILKTEATPQVVVSTVKEVLGIEGKAENR